LNEAGFSRVFNAQRAFSRARFFLMYPLEKCKIALVLRVKQPYFAGKGLK